MRRVVRCFSYPPLGVRGIVLQIRSSAWLEHYTDNVGVSSSNLDGSTATAEALGEGGQ